MPDPCLQKYYVTSIGEFQIITLTDMDSCEASIVLNLQLNYVLQLRYSQNTDCDSMPLLGAFASNEYNNYFKLTGKL